MRAALVAVLSSGGLAIAACSSPDSNARVDATALDRVTFRNVEPVLGRRCGTIDCHGSTYRNFRIYGYGGLRLDPSQRPDEPDASTTSEAEATYDALVSLEPELTRNVALARGAGADSHRFGRRSEVHALRGGDVFAFGYRDRNRYLDRVCARAASRSRHSPRIGDGWPYGLAS